MIVPLYTPWYCRVMRFSRLFATTLRDAPAEAEVVSHQLLLRAGYIRRVASGVYNYLPLMKRVLTNIETIIREEMDAAGAQELLLPIYQPAELWQDSGRWEHYGKELFRLQDRHGRDAALGPTHEEVITALARTELRSHKQLPVNLYQIQNKYRDEIRPRFGLLRGREFLMKDAYSFHSSQADLDREYDVMAAVYTRLFKRCGLDTKMVRSDSGAIGGSVSHEFMVLTGQASDGQQSGENDVIVCSHCDYSANREWSEQDLNLPTSDDSAEALATVLSNPCPNCGAELSSTRGIEVGNIFQLGTKYSQAMGATYLGEDQKEHPLLMGCYGIGVSRLAAAAVEQHHDDWGICWPESLAPYRVVITIANLKDETQRQLGEQLYAQFQEAKVSVILDDRPERAGVKFKDADLMGFPIRVTVGKKASEGLVELKRRNEKHATDVNAQALLPAL